MEDYIKEFEQRYNLCKKHNMTLPVAVLAKKLHDTACLHENSRQLALTACTDLSKFLEEKTTETSKSSNTQDAGFFFTNQRPAVKFRRSSSSSQTRQRQLQQGTNPLDKRWRRTTCTICQSTYHWAKDCPRPRNNLKLTEDEGVKNVTLHYSLKQI